ncbi:MAG: hypothetical protein RIS35_406, partial [Pseudomonadota bacterium]
MRPFLVTELQAGKLPRWGLLLLCVLYILPGFVGRDPWRTADAEGFGIALTMARGDASDWLIPNIAGEAVTRDGPLPFWIGATFVRAAGPLAAWVGEHALVRLASMTVLALALLAFWYGAYALARRPGVQPTDPFGAGASRTDFGRAIADSALLVLMATLGLIATVHETTADAAQIALCALFLYGAATVHQNPTRGGLLAGFAVGASVATTGLVQAGLMGITAVLLPAVSPQYRLTAGRWLPTMLVTGVILGALWPLGLALSGPAGQEHLGEWLGA